MDSTKRRTNTEIGAHEEKLPWELIEEILSRVPPKSLVRFRTVSKRWNALFDDKTFINNHKSTFRFILTTKSKIYSVSIDPKIVVRELTLDIPGLGSQIPNDLVDCDEFLLCRMDQGAAVWNPWLNQSTWIKAEVSRPRLQLDGIGYDSNKRVVESVYKTIWSKYPSEWKIHDLASDTWKNVESDNSDSDNSSDQGAKRKRSTLHSTGVVSLNGTLYWIAFYNKTDPLYHLTNFDFSREGFYTFCDLPCGNNHLQDALVLRVFNGDRFSFLKQCHITKKIEIWVTKNKINVGGGADVVWMNFMAVSIPEFPGLVHTGSYSQPSYFIDNKRLVVCSCDETGLAWIYVVAENKLISKVHINYVVDPRPFHCTYFPSLVTVPRCQRDEAGLQV